MKKLLIGLLIVSGQVFAADDPYEKFNAEKLVSARTTIDWIRADNVTAACNAESKRLGKPAFPYEVLACSFHSTNSCTIITGKNTTMWSLGHETRHCFQGEWHN